jgi:putative tryptophan/tyrosine transport system substrate-binding protein
MRRRDLIASLAATAAVAWPRATRAQQKAMPVIGLLNSRAVDEAPYLAAAFRHGLQEAGYVKDQNVAIEGRFANNQYGRLPELAADLVNRQVTVIVALTTPAALAAKAATAAIPIVFEGAMDPVQLGLVTSLNRPGGNITGMTQLNSEIGPKRLELLHELLPKVSVIGLLFNPKNVVAQPQLDNALSAARALRLDLHVENASSEADFEPAFAKLKEVRAGGLAINSDPFFTARQEQLAALTVRDRIPAVYENRAFVAAGGLASYGGAITEAYRLAGVYAGRILNGEKPGELPVQQVTKVELFLNLKTAKALGVAIPQLLFARADEVIE